MRTLLEAVRECPDRSGVVVAFQGNSSLQSLQKSWHRHANTLQRPWCPACTIRQSQTISRIHMEFIHQMISIEIDWWMLMNVDDVDDIWSCNQHTYTYLADLNDLNCHVPLPASEHLWSEEQYSVAELVSMAMRIVEASRSITWDIWDQEQRTSAGTLNLTNLSVDSTSREAGAEACWNRPCGSMWIHWGSVARSTHINGQILLFWIHLRILCLLRKNDGFT